MPNLPKPQIQMSDTDPEVKSYIYQQLLEFEPYVTQDTTVAVLSRDPMKMKLRYESEGRFFDANQLKNMYRIAIVLKEGETKLQAEGLHEDIFEAIRLAKEKLLKKLSAIQDSVVSNQERVDQINTALQNNQLH